MAKRKKKPKLKLAPKNKAVLLRPENDPDTVLERCKGKYESLLVIGWSKRGDYLRDDFTQNLTEPDLNMLIDQYKHWLFMAEADDE